MYILIALAVLIALLLIVAAMKPNISINAAPERILPHLNDYRKWLAWSPYEKLDPNMKREFGGASEGKGARYAWEGNGKVGVGSMEILESSPSSVRMDLRFIQPFKTTCIATFRLAPQGGSTQVTWMMDGPNLFMGKLMSVFMNMDKMIGGQFAEGLVALKVVAEK